MRRDNGEWSAVELPRTTTSEGARFLDDLTTHGDGRVWVSGQYLNGRIGDGTVWVLEEDGWREYPSNKRTGSPRFLAGANAPYVYALPEDRSDGVVVYAPKRGWATVAASSEPAVKLLFWSPDGQLWKSTEQGLARFDDESATSSGSAPLGNKTGCTVTVAWDNQTVLCSRLSGGLSYLTPGEGGLLVERQPIPEREALDPKAFGESPTPVWAQDATAWPASVNDVWKMPLDHYDGATWASFLESDDDFEPFRLSGTGSSDVWFLSESQLRHWDGAEVSLVSLPSPEAPPDESDQFSRLVTVRALTESDVWVMRLVQNGGTSIIEFLHGEGGVWTTPYRAATNDMLSVMNTRDVIHYGGTFAGEPNDLWATFGQSVLHFDGSSWSQVWRFPAEDLGVGQTRDTSITDAAADGEELWLSTDTGVYLLRNGEVTLKGYEAALPQLSLTADYVWNFDGARARRLDRDK